MESSDIPSGIVERFRTLALERLEGLEGAWTMLSQEPDEMILSEMLRDLHTLKGDAISVGCTDVGLICHKLEEILLLVQNGHHHISEDIDLVVTMSFHFLGALIRKKSGKTLAGLDLPGFLQQMDEALREASSRQSEPTSSPELRAVSTTQTTPKARRLAIVATDVFLEYLQASGHSKERLYEAFTSLVEHLSDVEAVPLAPLLARHLSSARELARSLQKELNISLEIEEDLRAHPKIADALDTATLHLIRNALDHAIEAPALREQHGKSAAGAVTIRVTESDKIIELRVEDDGQGINIEKVKASAVALGLLNREHNPTEDELLELLFHPGLSTASQVSEISGRGIGLDAARAALLKHGGSLRFETQAGRSTAAIINIPQGASMLQVRAFPSAREGLLLAVPISWSPIPGGASPLDVLARLHVPASSAASLTLSFQREEATISLLGAGSSSVCSAARLCPTGDLHPVEVISIRGALALLLHPEALLKPHRE
jgi:two-component system chemotaxis sensor kinase CheA